MPVIVTPAFTPEHLERNRQDYARKNLTIYEAAYVALAEAFAVRPPHW